MPQTVERLFSWVRRRSTGRRNMPQAGRSGTRETRNVVEPEPGNQSDELSPQEIRSRIARVTERLAELDAFQDTSAVPMTNLSDEQLEERIRYFETELAAIEGEATFTSGPADLDVEDRRAVLRHLNLLEYMIEHPDTSIAPIQALEDEPAQWASRIPSEEPSARPD